jgi:hypothetical protein
MKPTTEFKSALAAAQEIAAERRRLLDRADQLEQGIKQAAQDREVALQRLGEAEAGGDTNAIERARAAYQSAMLKYSGVFEGRRYVTSRLSDLSQRAKGPMEALQQEVDVHGRVVADEQQAEFIKLVEGFATAARRMVGQCAAFGVPNVKLATLSTLPGITAPVSMNLDYHEDSGAVKIYEQNSAAVAVLNEIRNLPNEVQNRRIVEDGRTGERPSFEEVADNPTFICLREVKINGEVYPPGALFPAAVVNRALLGSLYRSFHLAPRRAA